MYRLRIKGRHPVAGNAVLQAAPGIDWIPAFAGMKDKLLIKEALNILSF